MNQKIRRKLLIQRFKLNSQFALWDMKKSKQKDDGFIKSGKKIILNVKIKLQGRI